MHSSLSRQAFSIDEDFIRTGSSEGPCDINNNVNTDNIINNINDSIVNNRGTIPMTIPYPTRPHSSYLRIHDNINNNNYCDDNEDDDINNNQPAIVNIEEHSRNSSHKQKPRSKCYQTPEGAYAFKSDDALKSNGASSSARSHRHPIFADGPAPFNSERSYRYPVFAEGADAFKRARKDPMACNISNDMVLLWNDVFLSDDESSPTRNGAKQQKKPLRDLSVNEVFDSLYRAAEQHGKLKKSWKEGANPERCSGRRSSSLESLAKRNKRHRVSSDSTNNKSPRQSRRHGDSEAKANSNSNSTSVKVNSEATTKNQFRNIRIVTDSQSDLENEMKSPVSISNPIPQRVVYLEHPANPGTYLVTNQPLSSPSTSPSKEGQELEPACGSPLDEDSSEHFHEHYTDFSNESPVTFILSCNAACPCHCPKNDFWIAGQDCQCCECCFQIDSISYQKPTPVGKGKANKLHSYQLIPCCCNGDYYRSQCQQQQQQQQRTLKHRVNKSHGEDELNNIEDHIYVNVDLPVNLGSHTTQTNVILTCGNPACTNIARSPKDTPNNTGSKTTYKSCHHCFTAYCSTACRKSDWHRHKTYFCYGSLVNSTCKDVLRFCRHDERTRGVFSRLAKRGYLAKGRGCLLVGFPDLESAREFLEEGVSVLALRPVYISLKELARTKMHGDVHHDLRSLCRQYNPALKYIINVGIGLYRDQRDLTYDHDVCNNREPQGNIKHHFDNVHNCGHAQLNQNQNQNQCCHFEEKLIDSSFHYGVSCHHQINNNNTQQLANDVISHFHPWTLSRHSSPILQKSLKLRLQTASIPLHEHHVTFEKHWWDEFRTSGPTMILTGIPGSRSGETGRKSRELCLANIQRKLRHRGVNLRQQFPQVYSALIAYTAKGTHFPSQVLHPVDTKTGKTFTCFLMPEAEAELEWMQSHFLLDDLELSRDSINKSMSESESRSFS